VQPGSEALNLEQTLNVLRRRLPLIALCVVVVAGAALGFSKNQTKQYTATASLAFSSNPLNQQIAGLPAVSNSNLLAQQASNVELVKLGDMAAKTASLIGHGLTEAAVANSVSVSGQGESSVVEVSATVSSPRLAAEIANTYAQQFVREQRNTNLQYFKSALALVHKQLAALPPQQRFGTDGVALENRAQTLGFLAKLGYGNVEVAQVAPTPTAPSSPKTSRNTLIGGILGLLIGLGLAFLLERMNRRIEDPDVLAAAYGLPLVGSVAESPALAKATGHLTSLPRADAESFELIRAHIRFFDSNNDTHTILITSAEPKDGKTTIARHLAEAAARMGARVLLLEADLRNPVLARQLGAGDSRGLTDVLAGTASIDDVTQSIELESLSGRSEKTLDLLPAGAWRPSTPGQLIDSPTMKTLLERARSTYDLVVIDAPSLTTVWDAFPLLGKVDGVLVVGRVRRSQRDSVERLRDVLAGSGVRMLGVVANCVRRSSRRAQSDVAGVESTLPQEPPASSNAASQKETLLHTGNS
jgi:capsular exopolysaccharide synthesis family protein